jgi:hypothetical protein
VSTGLLRFKQDDLAFHEPMPCEGRAAPLIYYPTNHGLWIAVEAQDAPAKNVPSRFRWRLLTGTARNSRYAITVIALHLAGLEPRPLRRVVSSGHPVHADRAAKTLRHLSH